MKLAVITTAFFPADVWRERLRMFLRSCRKYNITVIPYGVGEPYCIWAQMKIAKKIPVFKRLIREGYSHVLYTDARDAFWCGPLEEFTAKYRTAGSPSCLAQTEKYCNPNSSKIPNYPETGTEYRFHCVGGYIAELPYMLNAFERMLPDVSKSGDDAEIWQWAWEAGWFRPVLDAKCEFFQVGSSLHEGEVAMVDGRFTNTITGGKPCIWHLNGGYSDPVKGKEESMLPWWRMIHPEIPESEVLIP